jgi:hypothetical protein
VSFTLIGAMPVDPHRAGVLGHGLAVMLTDGAVPGDRDESPPWLGRAAAGLLPAGDPGVRVGVGAVKGRVGGVGVPEPQRDAARSVRCRSVDYAGWVAR